MDIKKDMDLSNIILSAPQTKILALLSKQHGANLGGAKRAHVVAVGKALVRKGLAIQAIGCRFHISAAGRTFIASAESQSPITQPTKKQEE